MAMWRIDLFSDTKTRPSAAMREAMSRAEVGDEQQDEDPTVAALNERVAAILGKERALFLPSGTMANVVSILAHCRRGDEILADASSHVVNLETGGAAGLAGATVRAIDADGGIFDRPALEAALRPARRNAPRPRLIWVEQTTNLGGGRIWPPSILTDLRALADERGLALHIDGARLLNAAVAAGLAPSAYGAVAESVWIDFTKGLGAPFGAVLAGSDAFIDEARRYKHMLGGAMRQAGLMAAACLFALDHNVDRLADDHAAARRLGDGLRASGVFRVPDVETNIVLVDVALRGLSAAEVAARLASEGVRVGVFGPTALRLITHLDLHPGAVDETLEAFGRVADACRPGVGARKLAL